jgi:hypothetical protein
MSTLRLFKITLFLGIWVFIIGFSFHSASEFGHLDFLASDTFFLKHTYPVLLFLSGSIIYKYIKMLTSPLLVITSITCFIFVGKENAELIYLLPFYLVMYLGGYFGANWYQKNIQTDY